MTQQQLNTIKQAILNEIEGYEFYQLASTKAENEDSKQALLNLANEEMAHVSWLKALFNNLKNDSKDAFDLAMVSDPPSPKLYDIKMFGDQDAHSAMSVFGIGMKMEKAAVEFYTNAMHESTVPEAKELYSKLIEWEQQHYEQFAAAYNQLKNEWWENNNFAPF